MSPMRNLMVVNVVAQLKVMFVLISLFIDPIIHGNALTHVQIGEFSIQPALWGQPYVAWFIHVYP